jgi:hypothetical protein
MREEVEASVAMSNALFGKAKPKTVRKILLIK